MLWLIYVHVHERVPPKNPASCLSSALQVGPEVKKQIYYSAGLFNNPATQLLAVHWVSLSSPTLIVPAAQYVVTCVVETVLIDL